VFLKTHRIFKDGKAHIYYSLCESLRVSRKRVLQRRVLHLGELNTTQLERWQRTIEVVEENGRRHQMRLFTDRHGERKAAGAPEDVADVLLYDLTSTYFEGEAQEVDKAQRGYSRDHRPDCKQIIIALIVTPEGFPLSYEVFAGNRAEVTTLEEMLDAVERKHGRARRVWVFDRGIVSGEKRKTLSTSPSERPKSLRRRPVLASWRPARPPGSPKRAPTSERSPKRR
jgi:hypothetical protein